MILVLYNPLVSFCSEETSEATDTRAQMANGGLVLALYFSHNRHYFKTRRARAGSLPPSKGKKQLFLEAPWQNDIFAFGFLNLFSTGGLGDSEYQHFNG